MLYRLGQVECFFLLCTANSCVSIRLRLVRSQIHFLFLCFLKVGYSQKNIGDIFIAKQICCFTILNFVIWIFPPPWSVHSWHCQEAWNPAKLFLLLELSTKDSTNNVFINQKKINIVGWFDILVNKVQDWDWDTTLYSTWTQFQNFNFKIVIWHMCLAIWNINLTFWKKATFRSKVFHGNSKNLHKNFDSFFAKYSYKLNISLNQNSFSCPDFLGTL